MWVAVGASVRFYESWMEISTVGTLQELQNDCVMVLIVAQSCWRVGVTAEVSNIRVRNMVVTVACRLKSDVHRN